MCFLPLPKVSALSQDTLHLEGSPVDEACKHGYINIVIQVNGQ